MKQNSPTILLFNPWIYDFAAYDFWSKPLGLLHIAGMLRQTGYQTFLIDCLDRHHPVLLNFLGLEEAATKDDGTGKFYRKEIEKPSVYSFVPRKYSRYGMPTKVVEQLFENLPAEPDFIFVTTTMTYWYPAVSDAVKMLRLKFPKSYIVIGGIYASLCQEHAAHFIQPDYIYAGEADFRLLNLLNNTPKNANKNQNGKENFLVPDYSFYENLKSAAVLTSKGCPFSCSFCASKQIVFSHKRKNPQLVFKEIESLVVEKNVEHITFYDDALLFNSNKYFKSLLKRIIDSEMDLQMHTPNGLQIRYIDMEMAELFYKAGVKTIRLSFESSNESRQKEMFSKVKNSDLENALTYLEKAGYDRKDIAVYVMMGLPDQDIPEFEDSIKYVNDLGAKNSVASFSPIPGTVDWQSSIDSGYWCNDADLLLTNNSIFPIWHKKYNYDTCTDLMQWAKQKNISLN
jgi:radical SAM superfamily enzyme YgiQ (UPF0313 family)